MNIKNKKHHHRPLGFYGSVWHNPKNYRNFAIGLSAFLLAFVATSILAPVSNSSAEQQVLANVTSGDYSIAVTGQGTINLDVNQPDATGKLVTAADNLVIAANAPKGYKLYISMDNALAGGNRLYRGGVTTDAFLSPNKNSGGTDIAYGSEATLANNSWGFTTDTTKYNNNQFAAMPLSNNLALISQASVSGNYTQNVYYGVNANIDMVAGNYSGNIVYTITSDSIADTSGIRSVNPSTVSTVGGESVGITVALFSTAGISTVADLGDITVTIGENNCPVTNKTLSGNNVVITCTTPAETAGTKTIAVTIQKFGQTYEGEITYQDPPSMQDFTIEDCMDLTTSTSSSLVTVTLKDTRDNTEYRVSKLADGSCWMVDNLALDGTTDGTTPRTLTPSDSDVTSNYTFPSGVDISVGTSSQYSPAQIVTRDKNNTDNGNKYGNYYNYLAATAGWGTQSVTSGDTPSSVCPKGWKLPAYDGNKSYYNLLTTNYGVTSSNVWTTVRNAPLYFPAAGLHSSGVSLQGSGGNYWSRRVYSADRAYYLSFYSGNYSPQGNGDKSYGRSVRCVFDPPASMQEFTAQDCTNLTLSTSSVDNRKILRDTRDNTYYNIAKLADGNCWMVDNLALNGTTNGTTPRTLTTSDSDVTSNYTFPSGVDITVGTRSVNTTPQIVTRDKDKTDNNIKYGNYYNYPAATAGWGTQSVTSGDTPSSVCPKGWKLPAYSGDKSFRNLGSQYGLSHSNVWSTIRNAPLYFPATGYYSSGVGAQGGHGYYWSRRVYDASSAYLLFFYSGNYYPQNSNGGKSSGHSVRCVFGG